MTAVIKPLSDATILTVNHLYYPIDVAAESRQARPAPSANTATIL